MKPSNPHPLVVFDFDGTLADTWRDIAAALNLTLEEAHLPPVEGPQVRFWIGDGVGPLLRRALPPLEDELEFERLYDRFSEHYDRLCLETTDAYPGVRSCLERLAGASLAIASNKPLRFLTRIVAGLGWADRFEVVLGGDSLAVRKPDPAVIEHLVRGLGRPVGEVWMVGDGAIDVETGRAAGARTIGCAWGLRGLAELTEAEPEFVVERAEAIPSLILGR